MDDFQRFVSGYYARFIETLERFDREALDAILALLLRVGEQGGTLWIAGNGGSASIADHTACDVSKGTHREGAPPIRAISLASNAAMLTAIGNDIAFDQVFRKQLELYLQPGDAVMLVSASGSSPNVVEACRHAKEHGVPTIAFVGFDGGALKDMADHVIHVEVDNYGIAEDTHQSLIHVLSQYLATRRPDRSQSTSVAGDQA
jgi:phosphoheptose isomerase